MSALSYPKKRRPPPVADLLAAFREGLTFEEAARRIGVSSRTIFRWCDRDPKLAEAVAEARCKADDQVESVAYRNCLDPDPAHNVLRMFWLKCRRSEVYRDTQSVGVSVDVTVKVIRGVSMDDL